MKIFRVLLNNTKKHRCFVALLLCVFCIPTGFLEAVEPDARLFSENIEERHSVYSTIAQEITRKIDAANDVQTTQSYLLEQQVLTKLKEMPGSAEKHPIDLRFSEWASRETISWQDAEQFLERYVDILKEMKISTENQETTKIQMEKLADQLFEIDEKDSKNTLLQLQHAYQVRKFIHQKEISKQLKQGVIAAETAYPEMIKRITLQDQMVFEQKSNVRETKRKVEKHLQKARLESAANEARIQQQESILAGYLGHDLSDDDKRKMNYEQLKLLVMEVDQLLLDKKQQEERVNLLEEDLQASWFETISSRADFFILSDKVRDLKKQAEELQKDISSLHERMYQHEKDFSSLRGGNALVGPKAQELIRSLDVDIRSFFTQLSSVDQRRVKAEIKSRLLEKAIDLRQSSLGAMVTRTREVTDNFYEKIVTFLHNPLVSYNGMSISLLLLVQVAGLLTAGIAINRLYGAAVQKMGKKRRWSERTIHLVDALGKYPFIVAVGLIILSVAGVNTRSLALIAGALSVGIGFGMQTIVNNLVSGIILLFDKSIRPGDFISLGGGPDASGFRGNVVQMNIRATVLRTNDNINVIIPNADLMASQVVNWTYSDERIRFRVPFSVAYGTDIDRVKALIKDAMLALPVVMPYPEPQVWMAEHGESSLSFLAAIWVEGQNARQPARTSDSVLTAIYTTLQTNGIEIPFPQMDLRFRQPDGEKLEGERLLSILTRELYQKPAAV